MIRYLQVIIAALALSILASCSSAMIIKDQNQALGPDEAIVLTKINASAGSLVLSTGGMDDIYTAPIAESGRSITLKDGDNLLALKLKKGQSYKIARYNMFAFSQVTLSFDQPLTIKPTIDGMTYVGDIVVEPQFSSRYITGVKSNVSDNEEKTISQLKQKYPVLFEKYKYQKVLAQ